MAAMPASLNQSQMAGVFLEGNPHMKFVLDGRSVLGGSEHWGLEDHGFAFLSAQATSLSPEEFLDQPKHSPEMFTFEGPDAVATSASQPCPYYREIADACKSLVPDAEAVYTTYNILRKADKTFSADDFGGKEGPHKLAPRSQSQAEGIVCQMLAVFQYIEFFPREYKDRLGQQLHCDELGGSEAFLEQWLANHCKPKRENQHALMPEASPELIAEVSSLLRDDEYYSFLQRVRSMVPKPGSVESNQSKASEDMKGFQPPAVGGGHTDVSADGFLDQFRQSFPEDHKMSAVKPGHKRRVLFLKFWRNIAETPIVNHHLAMLDKSSLDDSDMHEHFLNFKGFPIKQNHFNDDVDFDKLRWVYFPCMQRDEVICFQQGDLTLHDGHRVSFPDLRQNHATFHGAFEDPHAPSGAPPRQSIECAAFVFLPEEPEAPARL